MMSKITGVKEEFLLKMVKRVRISVESNLLLKM